MPRNIIIDDADGSQNEFGMALFFGPARNYRDYQGAKDRQMHRRMHTDGGSNSEQRMDFFNPPTPHTFRDCTACSVTVRLGPNQTKLLAMYEAEKDGPMSEVLCIVCMYKMGTSGDARIAQADLATMKSAR